MASSSSWSDNEADESRDEKEWCRKMVWICIVVDGVVVNEGEESSVIIMNMVNGSCQSLWGQVRHGWRARLFSFS